MEIGDIKVGMSHHLRYTFTPESVRHFCELVNDFAPVHVDTNHAQSMGYKDMIVHGLFVTSNISGILGNHLPGPKSVINSVSVKMLKPAFVGETIDYYVTVKSVSASVKAVMLDFFAQNAAEQKIITGSAICSFPNS